MIQKRFKWQRTYKKYKRCEKCKAELLLYLFNKLVHNIKISYNFNQQYQLAHGKQGYWIASTGFVDPKRGKISIYYDEAWK
jgi:hypothetical protein